MTQKKSSKRKGVGIDFKKVKHKVGRKLPPPQNATNLTFKSKAIILPGQSLGQERDGLAVNHRNKTLKELFGQTTHYSERVRKDALLGIKDLFFQHPKELETNVISTVQKVSSRFTDTDKSVRHALLVLLRSIFPNIRKGVMQPLIPIMMAQIGSAMTHISSAIRFSAFSFLDLLLQHYPSLLVSSTDEIMQYYQLFLGQGGVDPSTMATILDCLRRFLYVVRAPPASETCDSTPMHTWLKKYDIEKALKALYAYKSHITEPVQSTKISSDSFKSEGVSSFIHVLLNCWAECVPAVCSSPVPDAAALECMVSISNCFSIIFEWLETTCGLPSFYTLRAEFRDKYLSAFIARFMAPFPISAPSVRVSPKIEEGLCALNVSICKVMLHFFTPNLKTSNSTANVLLQYYLDALSGQMLPCSQLEGKVIEPHMTTLLTKLPCLVECVEIDWKFKLLEAVTNVFETWHSQSSIKLACLSTMSKVLVSESRHQPEDPSMKSMREHFSRTWLQTFPKFLWELKHNHSSSSKIVLEIMLLLGKSAVPGSALAEEFAKLQPGMLPFFCTFLPAKCIFGPFIKLPRECQEIAVDILYYFNTFQAPFLKALATCCLCTCMEPHVVVRLLEVLQAAYHQEHISTPAYLSFIFTVLTGNSPLREQVDADVFEKKHQVAVGVLCHSLRRMGDGDVILELLGNPMSEYLVKEASPDILCRFLRVIVELSQTHGRNGDLNLPVALQDVISQQAAQCIISQLLVEDGRPPVVMLKYTILLIYRSKSFGSSFLRALIDLVISDMKHVLAVARVLIELLKQDGIRQYLFQSDVDTVVSALKEIRGNEPSSQNRLQHVVCQLDLTIKVAFGG